MKPHGLVVGSDPAAIERREQARERAARASQNAPVQADYSLTVEVTRRMNKAVVSLERMAPDVAAARK